MLSVFRSNANNWFMIVVFAIITFVFVFTFGSWGGGNVSGGMPVAATVNGHVVSMSQFKAEYSRAFRMSSAYQPGFTAEKAREQHLDQSVLDRLITQELLAQAAEKRGLAVSDAEVSAAIEERFFGKDKAFDPEEYKRIVNGIYNTTEARFETQLRRELLAARYETILQDAQHVSEGEVKESFEAQNNRADIELVKFDPQFYQSGIKAPSDADVATWAAANAAAVRAFYDEHLNRYRQPKKVKARHILVKVAEGATDEDKKNARTKIDAAKKRADAGEDFAKLAEEISEDSSAKSGGDLGFFGPGAMVKPFEDAAFAMAKGAISAVVESRFGFHVIKVDDVQEPITKEVKDVQAQIALELMKDSQLMAAARKAADAALAEATTGVAFADLKVAGLVKPPADGASSKAGDFDPLAPKLDSTGWFSKTARAIPRVGLAPELMTVVFEQLTMQKPLHDSVVEVNKRLFIVKLKSRELPDAAKFAAEREAIEQRLLGGRRGQLVEQLGKDLREKAKIVKSDNLLSG